jgi:TPR repeat protein
MKSLGLSKKWLLGCLCIGISTLRPAQGQDIAGLIDKANGGDSEAQHQVAQRYLNGTGVEKDVSKAIIWHRKAAEQGNSASQFFLHYKLNESGAAYRDPVEAYMWMYVLLDGNPDSTGMFDRNKALENRAKGLTEDQVKEALARAKVIQARIISSPIARLSALAAKGDINAQNDLGHHYFTGEGVTRDPVKAHALFLASAERGHQTGQYNLALCYLDGVGAAKDERLAFTWFMKAASSGHPGAQYNVGLCYLNGIGISVKNEQEGIRWLSMAGGNGSLDAQYNLGVIYANGFGVPQDYHKAREWFFKSALQGDAESMFNLGVSHDRGLGAERNDIEALAWYRLALQKGFKPALTNIPIVQARMSPSQVEKAYGRAIELILDHKLPVAVPAK